MTPAEFMIIVLWLFLPAVCLGAVALRVWTLRRSVSKQRVWVVAGASVPLAITFGIALLAVGSGWLPSWMGVQDISIFGWQTMWSPTPFLAVALALPLALWIAVRERRIN